MCCDGVFNDFVLFVGYDVCFDVLFQCEDGDCVFVDCKGWCGYDWW